MKQYIEKAALMDHVEREARRWGFDYDYEQILGRKLYRLYHFLLGMWYCKKSSNEVRHTRC